MKPFKEVYKNANSMTLNVTNGCNLNCAYCFEHEKVNDTLMPADVAVKAVDLMYRKLDGREPFTINFFGGEPMLNWFTVKAVINHCKSMNYKVRYGITTNLTILTDEMIKYIDDFSIPILVSIDGIKSVHDKNRCNSYDKVYTNLKRLIDAGLGIFIEARMTIMPDTIQYAMDGIKELYKLGINNFCPMPVYDVEWNNEQIDEYKKFMSEVVDFFIDIMNDKDNTRNVSIKNVDDMLVNIMSPDMDDPIMCPIFETSWCTIDYKGDVYACHQGPTSSEEQRKLLKVGNLDYIDEEKMVTEKKKASYPKENCKECIGKSICKCGCPTENLRMTGIYDAPTDSYCALQTALVEIIQKKQLDIIKSENIHNRMLVRIQESLKIKNYVDSMFRDMNMMDPIEVSFRVNHLNDMMTNLGDNIIPQFYDYALKRIEELTAFIAGLYNYEITFECFKEEGAIDANSNN